MLKISVVSQVTEETKRLSSRSRVQGEGTPVLDMFTGNHRESGLLSFQRDGRADGTNTAAGRVPRVQYYVRHRVSHAVILDSVVSLNGFTPLGGGVCVNEKWLRVVKQRSGVW